MVCSHDINICLSIDLFSCCFELLLHYGSGIGKETVLDENK